jgi:hypothetical protein
MSNSTVTIWWTTSTSYFNFHTISLMINQSTSSAVIQFYQSSLCGSSAWSPTSSVVNHPFVSIHTMFPQLEQCNSPHLFCSIRILWYLQHLFTTFFRAWHKILSCTAAFKNTLNIVLLRHCKIGFLQECTHTHTNPLPGELIGDAVSSNVGFGTQVDGVFDALEKLEQEATPSPAGL